MSRGGFRIPAGQIKINRTTDEPSPIVPELRTDIFDRWLLVAEESSDAAEKAREAALDADKADNDGFHDALEHEFRASLVTITAAAFAIDAFLGSVIEHTPGTKVSASSRDGTVFETLKRAFVLSGAFQSALHEPLRMIYRLRDRAVHPPASWAKPILHPAFNLGMEPRFVNYTSENAIRAHFVAGKLIATCLRNPKPGHSDLKRWCEGIEDLVPVPSPPEWVALDDPFAE